MPEFDSLAYSIEISGWSSEALEEAYASAALRAVQMDGKTVDHDPMEDLADLIASKPGESIHDLRQMDFEADLGIADTRARANAIRDELRRRGVEPVWTKDGFSFAKAAPDTDTGYYDDGHALGWKPSSDASAVDPTADTGYYDDGHAFGWKAAAPVGLPLPLLIGGGVVGLIVLGGVFFALTGGGGTSTAPQLTPPGAVASAPAGTGTPQATPPAAAVSAASQGYQCSGPEIELFNSWNTSAVLGGGTPPTFSTGGKTYCLLWAATYHWNGGRGAPPGRIELVGGSGAISGQVASSGGAAQVDWVFTPAVETRPLLSGSYTCRDSDPTTWAQNEASGKQGFCKVIVQNAVK